MYQLSDIIMINTGHSIYLGCHTRAKSILIMHMNFFAPTTISLELLQILKTKKVNKSIKEEMVSAPCYCVSNFRKLQHTKVLFTGFQRTKYLPTLTYACRNEGSSKKRNFNSIWQHEFSSALICNVQNDFMVEKSHFMTHT